MPKYTYKPVTSFIVETYNTISGRDIYQDLGNVDFTKATLIIEADTAEEALNISKGITNIDMWAEGPIEN